MNKQKGAKACRCVLFTTLAAMLAGCATPVPEALPAKSLPQQFTGPVPAPAQIWPEASWWRGFGDPQLTSLIEEAERNNGDLAVAAARVLQAEAKAGMQRSTLFPQISGGASHENGGCRGQSCAQYSDSKAFALNFNASYELDFWGLARDNLRAANEQLKSARFAQQSVALSVAAGAANQYLNVLALRSRIAIANENIAAINGILDVIKLRVKAGSASRLDLAREEAQVEAVNAQFPALDTAERQAVFTLAVLLGRAPEGFEVATGTLDAVKPPAVGPGLASALLLRRPDIAQAEADLAAAHANVDAARAAFLPHISLAGSGGFISAAVGTLVQGSNFGYGYGADLLQTIFDGGKLIADRDLAQATEQEYVARYRNAAFNAYADVEIALVQVANTGRQQAHLTREVAAAREAFKISQLQYRQGASDLLTVLQAQQTLFSAEDQLVQVMLANRQASVQLFEALGGGWVEATDERTQLAAQSRHP